jgi:hypothetical protein
MEEWRHSSTIIDLSSRWRWVVSFMLQPLYILGKSPWYPMYRRLCGLQSKCGHWSRGKSLAPAGN